MFIGRRVRRASALAAVSSAVAVCGPGIALAPSAAAATRYCAEVTPLSQRPTLYQGDDGWCVKELQSRLARNGYASNKTGYFGPVTAGYVKNFQTKKGISATGVVNSATWLKLMGGDAQETPAYTSSTQYFENRGPNHTNRIVLSFDDCPKSYTAFKSMVDGAAAQKVTLVLAATGDCQKGSTFSSSYARSKGQIVIGHSMTHPNLRTLSDAEVLAQIDPASAGAGYMRPPFGSWDGRVTSLMGSKGVRLWAWTRDTGDWAGASQSSIVNYVSTTSQPGDTILAHMGWNAFNPTALSQMKAGLGKRGLSFCQAYVGNTAPVALPSNLPC
ncbi:MULTISPECIES: peptidoglycan-binding protein [Dermacoccus]|uniref:Uncharacterized protein n=2 Tax=Dermacoccus TaxID=57495 RepID=A0A417Z1I5_9MICO|nr:peptidoglycan-binding protein [Dermacoccus abyssi]RHW44377.1 hypothetical protein D1832_12495 [Dermacoccus abyssi]